MSYERGLIKDKNGFSIYEMLVVLIILGIITAISLPIIYIQVMHHNVESVSLQLQAIVAEAQTQAVHRGANITICAAEFNNRSQYDKTYLNDCGTNWDEGLLSYIDLDSDNVYDTGERIRALRLDDNVNISVKNNNNEIYNFTFDNTGQILSSNTITVYLNQSMLGIAYQKLICINQLGTLCIKKDGDINACNSNMCD